MSIFNKFKKEKDEVEVKPESAKVSVAPKETDQEINKSTKQTEKKVDNVAVDEKAVPAKGVKTKKAVYGVLIRPLITEKATILASFNQYVFEVSEKANKIQIAQAIEAKYGILPEKVNVIKNEGKVVRFGRNFGRQKSWKKAIVTLPKGKSIQIHEGV